MTIDLTDPNLDSFDEPRKRVSVIAGGGRLTPDRERTLAALERAFPVRFELSGSADPEGADGVLVLGPGSLESTPAGLPRLVLSSHEPQPGSGAHNGVANASVSSGAAPRVVLADGPELARPLRGRTIPEHTPTGALPAMAAGATVLAQSEHRPVWWQTGEAGAELGVSAYPLAALRDGEALREQLRAGCFMGLLPLSHFLGQLLGADGWKLPSPRASFIVDDPNLHWRSYGFLDYPELIAHAKR